MRDPFAKSEIDPGGVVDEKAQRIGAGPLDSDQVDIAVKLGQLLLNVLLEVGHAWGVGVKKVGQAHFSTRIGDRKA
jgi:hypothetical protein